MIVNLEKEELFKCESLELKKNKTFILGKNGTGKTTLVKCFKEMDGYDVRVFDGFNNIIDNNEQLNAVILGEDNTLINKQITAINDEIEIHEKEKDSILKTLSKPDNDADDNYWTRRNKAQKVLEDKEKEIDRFYTEAANTIKRKLSIISTYNKNNFKADCENALMLSEDVKQQLENIVKSETKIAPTISFPVYDYVKILKETNELLQKKVVEKKRVVRVDSSLKRNFAETGLKIHKRGDVCSFCGSKIEDSVFDELESYFSVDEVKELQTELDDTIGEMNNILVDISSTRIDVDMFYPQFQKEINELKNSLNELADAQKLFIEIIIDNLKNKKGNLFDELSTIEIDSPDNFSNLQMAYDLIKNNNNDNDLETSKLEANKKLKLHYVKEQLDNFQYDTKLGELSILKKEANDRENEFRVQEAKVIGDNGIDSQINLLKNKITVLQGKTKNETILVQRIKEKLGNMVSFELELCEDAESNGIYKVKDIYTGEIRDITELSTGEKNIVAFLYFLEKLNEIDENKENKPKLIVFDDPMNSNDDNMQYLIIEELNKLIRTIEKDDVFVLLTHNNHFYLNITYNQKDENTMRIHLKKSGKSTTISEVLRKSDIKTSYEALWGELIYIYESDASPNMMLNPIRRIIETYTKFNGIDKTVFYSKVSGAKKLFDVNSHSIDDLEADLCGKDKEDIRMLLYECFEKNNSLEHFNNYWK